MEKIESIGVNYNITLHIKDRDLLVGLYEYFNSYFPGVIFQNYGTRTIKGVYFTNKVVSLKISSLSNINNIIIPLLFFF